jgi:hypothetical protein
MYLFSSAKHLSFRPKGEITQASLQRLANLGTELLV